MKNTSLYDKSFSECYLEQLEKLKKELLKESENIDCTVGIINSLECSKQIFQKLITKYNGWIPVSQRLPEEHINPITKDYYVYPVIYKNDNVTDIRYYSYGNGHWYHGLQIMDDYITAWFELPKPY